MEMRDKDREKKREDPKRVMLERKELLSPPTEARTGAEPPVASMQMERVPVWIGMGE